VADPYSLQLANDIRALIEKPPHSEEDLQRWRNEAHLIAEKLRTVYPPSLADQIPEELEHYISDPDIRLKDKGYDKWQTQIILGIVHNLEAGEYSDFPAYRIRRRARRGFH
jgi:hypothetical protein